MLEVSLHRVPSRLEVSLMHRVPSSPPTYSSHYITLYRVPREFLEVSLILSNHSRGFISNPNSPCSRGTQEVSLTNRVPCITPSLSPTSLEVSLARVPR